MRILLIGKYPPCQGGVSARTYWLYKGLVKVYGLKFNVVTMIDPPYITPCNEYVNDILTKVISVKQNDKPWIIPDVDLAVERLCTVALEFSDFYKPDIIECNYLAPYGIAAAFIAKYLKCPLVLRPASSDIAKLLMWTDTKQSIIAVLRSATAIMLPPERIGLFNNIPDLKILSAPRYVADSAYFVPTQPPNERILLVTGKINYHWRLKALDTLISVFQDLSGWHLRLAIDGKYRDEFINLLETKLNSSQYTLSGFVSPNRIPALLEKSWAVWNVHRAGGVQDFPNTHWEALAVGRYSLVSPVIYKHSDMLKTRNHPLVVQVDPDNESSIKTKLIELSAPIVELPFSFPSKKFSQYLAVHRNIYEGAI